MKNEGFTLVELLAVLLILAFIAIIAVPQILNLIEQSKIKSLKLSTSEYIRAVNTSLINEEVFNNVKDGLYTIADDGKKIVLGDREIYIASEGHGLRSGLLLIEDSKVKRVLKGMIDDYYARVNGEEITILKNLNESTLVSGTSFNAKIKNLVGDEGTDGADPNYNTVDTIVKSIIFLQDSVLPEGLTKEQLQALPSTDLSSTGESIKGYYDTTNQIIYVYSDGYISCPVSLRYFFQNFQGVEEIELNLIDTSKVTNMSGMFCACKSLKNINLLGLNTSKVTDMDDLFATCSSLTELDLSNFNTSNLTGMGDWNGGTFANCKNLKEIKGLENFDTSKVTDMDGLFSGCSSLEKLDLSNFKFSELLYMPNMFKGCTNLKSVIFNKNINTDKLATMNSMFQNCSNLEIIDLSMFKTNKVITMEFMFSGCINLKEIIGIEKFVTSKVTTMNSMFNGCRNLTSIDVSNFDTSLVTDMRGMFTNCSKITNLNLKKFNTSRVIYMGWRGAGMFQGCSSLKSLDLSSFDTSQVTVPDDMFAGCSSLEELDLTSFDTNNVTSTTISGMFNNCTNLKIVKVKKDKWTLEYNKVGLKDGILQYVD